MKDPLVIIGAGRSGTNALRDALTSLDAYSTWPCDEINYVWRAGNRTAQNDELCPQHATDQARITIQGAFERQAAKRPTTRLVEKTCANSLRVQFVNEIFPEARFVHILRDGRDVASSAMSRWTAPLDIRYVARKARFVPRRDLLYYASRYLRSRLSRRQADDARLSTWGPRFDGIDELVAANTPLEVICAQQWSHCVNASLDQFEHVEAARVITVFYDDFVSNPVAELRRIIEFSGDAVPDSAVEAAAASIHGDSAQAWSSRLSEVQIEAITPICRPVNDRISGLR